MPAEVKSIVSAIDKAKAELDRYLHYYQRYHGHDSALKFAATQRAQAEARMIEQQEAQKSSWIDVQFLKQAAEQVCVDVSVCFPSAAVMCFCCV